jgi:serine phosphatase RsbU (regulator of sigma subunit)
MPYSVYQVATAPLPPHGRALIISDGLVEQTQAEPIPGQPREQFDLVRVQAAIAATPTNTDPVHHLFDAVYEFAGTKSLSDDATAVMVTW